MFIGMNTGSVLQGIAQHAFQRPQPPKNFLVARKQSSDLAVEAGVKASEGSSVAVGVRPRHRVPRQRVHVGVDHEVGPR